MNEERLYAVFYALAPTKFYRAIAWVDSTGNAWATFNWGAGRPLNDPEVMFGQVQTVRRSNIALAEAACRQKIQAKTSKEYTDASPWHDRVIAQDHVPLRLKESAGLVMQPPSPKPSKPVRITTTTTSGALKPALANRVKFRASE